MNGCAGCLFWPIIAILFIFGLLFAWPVMLVAAALALIYAVIPKRTTQVINRDKNSVYNRPVCGNVSGTSCGQEKNPFPLKFKTLAIIYGSFLLICLIAVFIEKGYKLSALLLLTVVFYFAIVKFDILGRFFGINFFSNVPSNDELLKDIDTTQNDSAVNDCEMENVPEISSLIDSPGLNQCLFCPFCGKPFNCGDTPRFCPECGKNLTEKNVNVDL